MRYSVALTRHWVSMFVYMFGHERRLVTARAAVCTGWLLSPAGHYKPEIGPLRCLSRRRPPSTGASLRLRLRHRESCVTHSVLMEAGCDLRSPPLATLNFRGLQNTRSGSPARLARETRSAGRVLVVGLTRGRDRLPQKCNGLIRRRRDSSLLCAPR